MTKESIKGGISQAMSEFHQKQKEATAQENAAKKDYKRGARAVYKNIGEFIHELYKDPDYRVKGTSKDKFVKILTGPPTEWGELPAAAANFLGKQQPIGAGEKLIIHAHETEGLRRMTFLIQKRNEREERRIDISAVSKWSDKHVSIGFILSPPFPDAPEPIVHAYNHGITLQTQGGIAWDIEKLETIQALVKFAGREAAKEIKSRRH